MVRLVPKSLQDQAKAESGVLSRVTATAFMQRRKTLKNALQSLLRPEDFEFLQIDAKKRPEDLSLDEYLAVARFTASRYNYGSQIDG